MNNCFVRFSKHCLLFLCLFIPQTLFPQGRQENATLSGAVSDAAGKALSGVSVTINELHKNTITGEDGGFLFRNLPAGTYSVGITYIGYKQVVKKVTVQSNNTTRLAFRLEEDINHLNSVTVQGKSATRQAREQTIKAEVVDTRAIQHQPSSLIEVMNRSAGVRIRQTGGLGSAASLMLNGFQDKAIKYFKDGIPMDYLGAGYDITLVPVNMLERVDIYKGVMPAALGADALGGGVNMVTKKPFAKYLDAAYEIASFNTHRVSLNGFYNDTARKIFVGADAFFNYSRNNYEVTAPVDHNGTLVDEKVKLFHSRFSNFYTEVYGGWMNTPWADELRIGVTGFLINRQNQFGASMKDVFGAAANKQYAVIPTLRYRKHLFNNKLFVDQFFVANTVHSRQTDTARGKYDWYGNFTPDNSRVGEITRQGTLSDIRFSYFTSRTNLSWQLNAANKLELNAVFSSMGREGSDPYGAKLRGSGTDILTLPAHYKKLVTALGLETRLAGNMLVNNLVVKYYYYQVNATDGDYAGNEQRYATSGSRMGVAEAIKFNVSPYAFFRLSGEAATRLPEQTEIFGDGNFQLSNFALKPERSLNFNLGYRIEKPQRYAVEANSFYRITRDMILNVPTNLIFLQHQNIQNVKGIGLETDATVNIFRWLKANGNFTYQDFRLFNTGFATTEGARLRNTPYFFANLGLNGYLSHVVSRRDKLQVYWFYTFVRQYYLSDIPKSMEPDGFLGLWGKAGFDAPNIIPSQQLHTAGFTYYPFNERLSIGFQVKNIFNKAVYDNFRIQNAGRSLHLKVGYLFR